MQPLLQVAVPNHLGDAVMALPALRSLAAGLPRWKIRLVGRPLPARVLDGQGPWEPVQSSFCRDSGSAGLLLAPSFRVALAALRARITPRVGTPTDWRRVLLTDSVEVDVASCHQRNIYARAVEQTVELLGGEHIDASGDFEASDEGLEWWGTVGSPRILLHPWAQGSVAKRWPLARWVELGRSLDSVVVTGGPGAQDTELAQSLAQSLGVPCRAGVDCLSPTAWAGVARRARAVVVPDTGLAHLAAASGARVLVLFGATDPARFAPPGAEVLRGSSMEAIAPAEVLERLHA